MQIVKNPGLFSPLFPRCLACRKGRGLSGDLIYLKMNERISFNLSPLFIFSMGAFWDFFCCYVMILDLDLWYFHVPSVRSSNEMERRYSGFAT